MGVQLQSGELRVRSDGAVHGRSLEQRAAKEVLLRMVAEGRTVKECAIQLGRNEITLRRWAREPEFLERLKALNQLMFEKLDAELVQKAETTLQRIQQVSDDALDRVLFLMENADSEVVQMRCAQDLLDRNPETSKMHKVQSTKRIVHVDADLVNAVLGAEKEAGITING